MSYEVGTHIDISGVNRQNVEAPLRAKKSAFSSIEKGYAVGTQFVFQLTPQGLKAAINIPVAFA
jgi:hypothetical protein